MSKRVISMVIALAFSTVASAQDVPGIEDCTKAAGLDKRTGCLQSNVNFLQQVIAKNASDARQRLTAASNEIAALKSTIAALRTAVEQLQAEVKEIRKPDAKPEVKPEGKPDAKP